MGPKRRSVNRTNIYCYCVIGDRNGGKSLPGIEGIDNSHVLYPVSYRDISMIVSKVSCAEFSEDNLNSTIEDIAWLSRYAIRHEEIVEAVMRQYSPLLPLKFCSIYKTDVRVRTVLRSNYQGFTRALSYFKDKREYGVKIFVERDIFMGRNLDCARDIPKPMVSDPGRSKTRDCKHRCGGRYLDPGASVRTSVAKTTKLDLSGRDYLLKRRAEKEAQQAFIAQLSFRKQAMHAVLSEWAIDTVSHKTVDDPDKTKGKILVHNASYLVEDGCRERFYLVVKQLNDGYASDGFRLETSGPWPCYSFSSRVD